VGEPERHGGDDEAHCGVQLLRPVGRVGDAAARAAVHCSAPYCACGGDGGADYATAVVRACV
jgi:hypothetical protein